MKAAERSLAWIGAASFIAAGGVAATPPQSATSIALRGMAVAAMISILGLQVAYLVIQIRRRRSGEVGYRWNPSAVREALFACFAYLPASLFHDSLASALGSALEPAVSQSVANRAFVGSAMAVWAASLVCSRLIRPRFVPLSWLASSLTNGALAPHDQGPATGLASTAVPLEVPPPRRHDG